MDERGHCLIDSMILLFIIGLLCGVIIIQQINFNKQCQGLVDRIMSRDYHSFIQSEVAAKEAVLKKQEVRIEEPEPMEDLRTLELNI